MYRLCLPVLVRLPLPMAPEVHCLEQLSRHLVHSAPKQALVGSGHHSERAPAQLTSRCLPGLLSDLSSKPSSDQPLGQA